MADTGENAVSCEYCWRQYWYTYRYVYLSSQDETLVLCGRDATDIGIPGDCWIMDKEQMVMIRHVILWQLKDELSRVEDEGHNHFACGKIKGLHGL